MFAQAAKDKPVLVCCGVQCLQILTLQVILIGGRCTLC